MSSLTLGFKVHIPYRLGNQSTNGYFNNMTSCAIINKLADQCYLPANKIMLAEIKRQAGKFKLAFSISGTAIEQLQAYRPDVIASFKELVKTGCVEILAETYYNSLCWLYSKKEFRRQVTMHTELIKRLFDTEPVIVRNTELIYNNELANFAAGMGYKGVLCEGLGKILHGRTANQVYAAPGAGDFGLLLRNVSLSDDIAFRFDDLQWNEHPLTAEKYASWIHSHTGNSNIHIFMDYETFGIHKKATTGIFEFLENLPAAILENSSWQFATPEEILDTCYPRDIYDVPRTISWKDKDIESCVWCENMMQNNMLKKVYSLEEMIYKSGCDESLGWWGRLQSADHFYYMSDTGRTNSDGYHELNPFESGKSAYKNYLGIITDFEIKLIQHGLAKFKGEHHYFKNTSIY